MGRRLIDTDAAYEVLTDYYHHTTETQHAALREALGRVESVDAVPVVRCKDCKNSEHWYADRQRCFLWHENGVSVFDDGFCNYGERKDGDNG